MISVLFVCMGNICRSPMAEGIFRHYVLNEGLEKSFKIDSAGTTGYHAGNPPDYRAQAALIINGIDISSQRSRTLQRKDFDGFDYILAMDKDNYNDIISLAPPNTQAQISLLLQHHNRTDIKEIPDPYYGEEDGFDTVYDLIDHASKNLLNMLIKTHNLA